MKSQIISSMASFVLGTGATLVALSSWLGTTDLQEIKSSVQSYVMESEQHASQLLGEYNVTVDNANAEIGEYKDALAEANSNIDKLITAYNNAETEHQQELENANKQAEQDLKDLQAELDSMKTRLDSQYETDMNKVIEQANAQINQANKEVGDTKAYVDEVLENSLAGDIVQNGERHKLDKTGDKTVTDISSIVPTVPQE